MGPPPPDPGVTGVVKVTPADVNSAAGTFATQQDVLEKAWSTLEGALAGAEGMVGNDGGAQKFAARYDPAAKAAWDAFGAALRTLGGVATGLVTTANNYLKADAHSTATGGGAATPQLYPPPVVIADELMPGPAQAEGPGHSDVPDFLAKYWPTATRTSSARPPLPGAPRRAAWATSWPPARAR
jgi:hypothetical protein